MSIQSKDGPVGEFARKAADRVLGILYPRRCPVCGEILPPKAVWVCPDCLGGLSPVKQPVCLGCGKEVSGSQEEYCQDCLRRKRTFDSGMALLNYNEAARRSMSGIKYKNKREYLDFYAEAMWRRFGRQIARIGPDAWIPVPVHSSRRRTRGFNQAEELAKRLSRKSGIPVRADLLRRVKKTSPQKNLTPAQRFENLKNAFLCAPLPQEILNVVLVDDIYTTGSTAEACARALKQAGAGKVYLMVICIGGGRG